MLEELPLDPTESSDVAFFDDEKVWSYATIEGDSKVVHHVQLPKHRGTDPAAEFLVDGTGYLTALARTGLDGDFNYSDREIVEKLFQTFTMRIGRFHGIWNGSQASAERWLTAYTAYDNQFHSHQALDNQSPIRRCNSTAPLSVKHLF